MDLDRLGPPRIPHLHLRLPCQLHIVLHVHEGVADDESWLRPRLLRSRRPKGGQKPVLLHQQRLCEVFGLHILMDHRC